MTQKTQQTPKDNGSPSALFATAFVHTIQHYVQQEEEEATSDNHLGRVGSLADRHCSESCAVAVASERCRPSALHACRISERSL
jgi:hypothetical protein